MNLPVSFEQLGTYTGDLVQDYGYPYAKGYVNLQWATKYGSLIRFGADYEGDDGDQGQRERAGDQATSPLHLG